MAKKLFVGGLSWDTRDDGLRQAFASYGEVTEAKVITDRDTGYPLSGAAGGAQAGAAASTGPRRLRGP